ncbi:hypothetical protein MWH25_04835 [Natroniella acetigena]|uniref:hypothetical protein n=1 Tax=Natroniella acetigena TaxID=52004 RepID=UPI00200A846A|nr:hypothetical protein [Natroniella acetigena]MCK8827072.1 hypothetical protein [Natroniella acetigena]
MFFKRIIIIGVVLLLLGLVACVERYEIETVVKGEGDIIISPEQDTYEQGDEIRVFAEIPDSHKLVEWSGDLSGTEIEQQVEVKDDMVFKAKFERLNIWERAFGVSEKDLSFQAIEKTSDDGYLLVGGPDSFFRSDGLFYASNVVSDGYIIKIDAQGNKEWSRKYGADHYEGFKAVERTNDGGYIVVGYTESYGEDRPSGYLSKEDRKKNGYVVKINSSGDKEWKKSVGPSSVNNCFYSIKSTSDGNFILAGEMDAKGYMLKMDADGNKIWEEIYNNIEKSLFNTVKEVPDEGFVLAGTGRRDGAYLLKTDLDGNEVWSKTFGNEYANIYDIKRVDDSYILAGYDREDYGYSDLAYLLSVDLEGNINWSKHYDTGDFSSFKAVEKIDDGFKEGFILVGNMSGNGYVVRTDLMGNEMWSNTYGDRNLDLFYDLKPSSDYGYVIAGFSYSMGNILSDENIDKSDGYVIKIDYLGHTGELEIVR